MKILFKNIFLLCICLILLTSNIYAQFCEKITFQFFWNEKPLLLESPLLLGNDTIYLSKVQFYVSNFLVHNQKDKKKILNYPKLISTENNSFFMDKKIDLKKFTKISFALGLDEATNIGKYGQKQDLDPQNGMFWTWESGYVFWKMEGYFFENKRKRGLIYHLGRKNCYQEAFFELKNLQIENQNLILKIDFQKIWENQSLKSYPNNMMAGKETELLAKKIIGLFF